ncbi:acyl-ACP thioesterase [Oscillospiraceae bacterium]|nr:acyl-ACP thioesterase [Oscillospiraceae bacterium]
MPEPKTFTETFRVFDFECDINRKLLPGGALRISQQISTDHCDCLGLTADFYRANHAVFLLAKLACEFTRVPLIGETLTLVTLPETAKRAVYKRVTRILDEEGREIGLVDSRWVLVDTDTHRILRRPPEAFAALPFDEEVPFALNMEIPKPESTEPAGTARADYTLCDTNRHLNNTHYADVACNALPLEELERRAVRRIALNYHSEVPAGESFELERGRLDENTWYVAGQRGGKRCFEAKLTLE